MRAGVIPCACTRVLQTGADAKKPANREAALALATELHNAGMYTHKCTISYTAVQFTVALVYYLNDSCLTPSLVPPLIL